MITLKQTRPSMEALILRSKTRNETISKKRLESESLE